MTTNTNMIGKFGMKQTLTLLMLLATLLSGCDKLDDGDDDVMRSILPGAWAFSYVFHGDQELDPGLDFRIVSHEFGDEERILLWRVVSYTAKQITAEYDFSQNGKSATATVTLDKL